MSHTPGPWKHNKHPYSDQPEYVITEHEYLAQDEKGRYLTEGVAEVPHDSVKQRALIAVLDRSRNVQLGLRPQEEAIANAALIAAAPDMLALLKRFQELQCAQEVASLATQVDAVIAKAEGRG